jgi:flagellar motility protein MotE (MotC chaperone)
MLKIPTPRLLPTTIATMVVLLLLKGGLLLHAAVSHGPQPETAMVTAANAASTDQVKEPAKPGTPAGAPKPGAATAATPQAAQGASAPLPAPQQAPSGPPAVSDSEKTLLLDLRQRRQDLDARAAAIATRESLLVAAEQKLSARVGELQALQTKLEGLDAAQKQKEDAGWQGLVKLYEAMKPKDAATIFNDLQMPVLLQLMDRMKDTKAASIMAAMNPDKARDLTSELAQMRTGHDASDAPLAGIKNNLAGG